MRSGDRVDDELCHPPVVLSAVFNFECVAYSIGDARALTERAKEIFRNAPISTIFFDKSDAVEQWIYSFDAENHDDSYLQHNTQLDNRLQVGSFQLTVHFGEIK